MVHRGASPPGWMMFHVEPISPFAEALLNLEWPPPPSDSGGPESRTRRTRRAPRARESRRAAVAAPARRGSRHRGAGRRARPPDRRAATWVWTLRAATESERAAAPRRGAFAARARRDPERLDRRPG